MTSYALYPLDRHIITPEKNASSIIPCKNDYEEHVQNARGSRFAVWTHVLVSLIWMRVPVPNPPRLIRIANAWR